MARQAVATQAIPIKRVLLNDPSELPSHYSQTPGGTMFSTTPGGTKIIYERSFLLNLRNSPISKTPPAFDIPENLTKGSSPKKHSHNNNYHNNNHHQNNNHYQRKNNFALRKRNDSNNGRRNSSQDEDHQFPMDL